MLINTYRILNNFISGIDKQNAKKEQETRLFKTANDTLKKIKPIENKKADIDEFYKEILPKLSNEDAVKFSLAALNKLKKKEEYKYKILITRPTTSSREDGNRSKIKTSPDRNIAFLHYWKYLLRAPAGNKIFYKKDIKIDDLKPNELDWYHSLLLEANDSDYKSLREGEKDTDASIKYIGYLRNNPNPRTAELEKYLNTSLTTKMKKDAARRIFDRYLEDKKLVSSYLNKDKNNKISTLINLRIFNEQERAFLDARVKFVGDKNYVYKLTAKDESAKYDKDSEKDEVRDNYYLQLDKFRLAADSDIRQGNFNSAIKKYEKIVSAGANPNVEYAFLYAKCYERSGKQDNQTASFAQKHQEYFYKGIEQKLNHGEKTKLAWAAKAMLDADRDIDSFDEKIAKLNLAQENRTVYLKMQESKIDVLLELGRHNAVLKAVNLIENNYPDLSPDELVALKKKSILSYQKEKKHYEAQVIAKELLAKNISVENRTDLEFILVDSAITARLTKDKVVGQSKEIEAAVGLLKEPDSRALATDKIKYYKAVFYNYIYRKKIKGENFTAKEIEEINRFILDGQKNIKNIDQREFGWLIKDFNLKAAELNYLIAQDLDKVAQGEIYLKTAQKLINDTEMIIKENLSSDITALRWKVENALSYIEDKNQAGFFHQPDSWYLNLGMSVINNQTHSKYTYDINSLNLTSPENNIYQKSTDYLYSLDGGALFPITNKFKLGVYGGLNYLQHDASATKNEYRFISGGFNLTQNDYDDPNPSSKFDMMGYKLGFNMNYSFKPEKIKVLDFSLGYIKDLTVWSKFEFGSEVQRLAANNADLKQNNMIYQSGSVGASGKWLANKETSDLFFMFWDAQLKFTRKFVTGVKNESYLKLQDNGYTYNNVNEDSSFDQEKTAFEPGVRVGASFNGSTFFLEPFLGIKGSPVNWHNNDLTGSGKYGWEVQAGANTGAQFMFNFIEEDFYGRFAIGYEQSKFVNAPIINKKVSTSLLIKPQESDVSWLLEVNRSWNDNKAVKDSENKIDRWDFNFGVQKEF